MLTLDEIADTMVADMRARLQAAFDLMADELEMDIRAQVVHDMPAVLLSTHGVERSAMLH